MKKKLKCFVCHKEVNEEDDYVFKGQTVHKGECLKSMIDEYNAVRNLQIRNKRLCAEIERLNNIINRTTKYVESLSSSGRGCDIYEDIKKEILNELGGKNE